jgi:hypothetical protein
MQADEDLSLSETSSEVIRPEDNTNPPRLCLNCQTPLTGTYCPSCGQKDFPRRQTIGDLLINFISSFWSYESKFLLTGKLILFKPGRLPLEYNEGKRERYYHPARMYVFISFVYFLLLATLPDSDDDDINVTTDTEKPASRGYSSVGDDTSLAQYDSIQNTLPPEKRDGKFEQSIRRRLGNLNERYKGQGDQFTKDFGELFFSNTPRVFFVLLPIFALFLHLLYIRRDYFYSEHLIFSVYYYNFFFLAGSIYLLIDQIPVVKEFSFVFFVWMALYLLFAMKSMYKQSWGKTIAKYSAFVFVVTVAVLIGLVTNVIITLIII